MTRKIFVIVPDERLFMLFFSSKLNHVETLLLPTYDARKEIVRHANEISKNSFKNVFKFLQLKNDLPKLNFIFTIFFILHPLTRIIFKETFHKNLITQHSFHEQTFPRSFQSSLKYFFINDIYRLFIKRINDASHLI